MTVTHTTRPASADEIAAEMDRRGKVIERLEAEIDRLCSRLETQGQRLSSADGNREIMKGRLDRLREVNAALEVQLSESKEDVAVLHADMAALSDRFDEARTIERRDLFAAAALIGQMLTTLGVGPAFDAFFGAAEKAGIHPRAHMAANSFVIADAMEAARSEKEPG